MSEPKSTEKYRTISDETNAALEMLGKGYEPAIEIEPPRDVIVRDGERMIQAERAAFVKISTAFKDSGELKKVDEIALKVWLFIALSVNRQTGRAHPGLRTIAEGTGFAINTVRAALERLENYGLLTIYRGERKYHIYEPTAFVSANRNVSPNDTVCICITQDDTVEKSVSVEHESVSAKPESVSPRMILNQINQNNQKEREFSKIDFEKANKKVDAILENERKAQSSWKGRENFPEPIRDLLDVFVSLTGIRPSKSDLSQWLMEGNEWMEKGITAADLREAWKISNPPDGRGFMVTWPGSLTKTAAGCAGKRSISNKPQTIQERISASVTKPTKQDYVLID